MVSQNSLSLDDWVVQNIYAEATTLVNSLMTRGNNFPDIIKLYQIVHSSPPKDIYAFYLVSDQAAELLPESQFHFRLWFWPCTSLGNLTENSDIIRAYNQYCIDKKHEH
jgi:hypothetical protein